MKRQYLYILLIIVCIGGLAFVIVSNRGLRYEIKDLKKSNKELKATNELLHQENKELEEDLTDKEDKIKQSLVVYDSLKTILEKLNNQKIYVAGNHPTNLNLDDEIKFLAGFVGQDNPE